MERKGIDKLAAMCRIRAHAEMALNQMIDEPTDEIILDTALTQIAELCAAATFGKAVA